ncbi:MAG: ABC transporter permease [Parabacteroides sp.]
MNKVYFKQAWRLLKENRLLSVVSILGTALAICLVMVIVIVWQVRTAGFRPETHRDRMLFVRDGRAARKMNNTFNNCYRLSSSVVKEVFYPLQTAEAVGMATEVMSCLASTMDQTKELRADLRYTDAGFWQLFEFELLQGKPYPQEAVHSGLQEAVVSASLARQLFGTTEVVGQTLQLNYVPYRICAVVGDVSVMAEASHADVWAPYTSNSTLYDNNTEGLVGVFACYILAHSSADFPAIRAEVERNVGKLNASKQDWELVLAGQPDTRLDQLARDNGAFSEAHTGLLVLRYSLIVLLLMLVPAINMSGLTQSRMRQRMEELGVRRAFGATRGALVGQIILENLLQTLIGGVIGFGLSYAAVVGLSGWLLDTGETVEGLGQVFVGADMLFNPLIFLLAFVACLVLNLLSAGIPAWRAANNPIVESLSIHR